MPPSFPRRLLPGLAFLALGLLHRYPQGEMYEQAFGVNPAKVAPRWGITRLRRAP